MLSGQSQKRRFVPSSTALFDRPAFMETLSRGPMHSALARKENPHWRGLFPVQSSQALRKIADRNLVIITALRFVAPR